jgi:hypothetical protein
MPDLHETYEEAVSSTTHDGPCPDCGNSTEDVRTEGARSAVDCASTPAFGRFTVAHQQASAKRRKMSDNNEFDQNWPQAWEEHWKPLLTTDDHLDEQKVEKQMHDLVFTAEQASRVYRTPDRQPASGAHGLCR